MGPRLRLLLLLPLLWGGVAPAVAPAPPPALPRATYREFHIAVQSTLYDDDGAGGADGTAAAKAAAAAAYVPLTIANMNAALLRVTFAGPVRFVYADDATASPLHPAGLTRLVCDGGAGRGYRIFDSAPLPAGNRPRSPIPRRILSLAADYRHDFPENGSAEPAETLLLRTARMRTDYAPTANSWVGVMPLSSVQTVISTVDRFAPRPPPCETAAAGGHNTTNNTANSNHNSTNASSPSPGEEREENEEEEEEEEKEDNDDDDDAFQESSRTRYLALDTLRKCVVRFLEPEEQIVERPVRLSVAGRFFTGDVPLVGLTVAELLDATGYPFADENATTSAAATNSSNFTNSSHHKAGVNETTDDWTDPTVVDEMVQLAREAATRFAEGRERLVVRATDIWRSAGSMGSSVDHEHDNETCVPMPASDDHFLHNSTRQAQPQQTNENSEGDEDDDDDPTRSYKTRAYGPAVTSLAETAAELFVHGEEGMSHAMRALARLGVPDLGGVLMVPMKDVSKDFSELAAGTMADQQSGGVENKAAGQIDQSMTEQITGMLSRGLKSHLVETLVPPLKQTVVASVTSSTTQLFNVALTRVLTKELERPITEIVTDKYTNKIAGMLDEVTPNHAGRLLIRDLGHMLSRSVPHSLVPALVHTLTHSPMMDYYCYYCFHHKTYCQYCNYAPQQVYYALFYTGYYSTYYGDYFNDYVIRQMSSIELQKRKAKEEAKEVG